MDTVPAELIPGFCAYPRDVLALSATCSWLRNILCGRTKVFSCEVVSTTNTGYNYIVKSDWYAYKIHIIIVRGGFICEPSDDRVEFGCVPVSNPYEHVAKREPDYILAGGQNAPCFSFTVPWLYGVNIPKYNWFRKVRHIQRELPPVGLRGRVLCTSSTVNFNAFTPWMKYVNCDVDSDDNFAKYTAVYKNVSWS